MSNCIDAVKTSSPEEVGIARYCLSRLDMERYGEMLADYRNGLYDRIQTISEACEFAANYVQARKMGGIDNSGGKYVFATIGTPVKDKNPYISKSSTGVRGKSKKLHRKFRPDKDHPCRGCGATDHWIEECPHAVDAGEIWKDVG